MKAKIFLLFFLILFLTPSYSFAELEGSSNGFYDLDFNFIDNPFSGQKIITEQEFDKTYNQYKGNVKKKKTGGFWNWVFRKTLPEDMQYQEPVDIKKEIYSDEIKYQKEVLNKKPTIALSSTIIDSNGNEVQEGFYQVVLDNSKIKLQQGFDTIGIFNARKATDDWKENEIIYARLIFQNENVVKIIYSNLDDCYEAYGVVK